MTAYEWIVETVDEYEDIVETLAHETYREASATATRDAQDIGTKSHTGSIIIRIDIALTRLWSRDFEAEGMEDRQYAYLEDGKLPEYFEHTGGGTGAKVPKRFFAEMGGKQ